MFIQYFCSIVLIFVITNSNIGVYGKAGEIDLKTFHPESIESDYLQKVSGRAARFNRTFFVISCEFDLMKEANKDWRIVFNMLAKQGNEYRVLFTKKVDDYCEFTENDPFLYEDIQKHSNFPSREHGTCPLLPGHYSVKDLTINPDRLPKILMSAEEWKMNGIIFVKDLRVGQFTAEFTVSRF